MGFDEKLPLRGVLKVGVDVSDTIMLIYSKIGEELEVKNIERVVGEFKEVIRSIGTKIIEVEVFETNFFDDVMTILKSLKEQKADEVVAVLAGGSRIIIFETLFALLMLYRFGKFQQTRIKVLLMHEDGTYSIVLPLEYFYVTIPRNGLAVMRIIHNHREIKRSRLVEIASREAGLTISAVYKIIRDLNERGLIVIDGDTVKLTQLGYLIYLTSSPS
ncbi:MAG: hypothetical protein QW607_12575 [Desulfurococcaceae archaeon]